MPEQIKVKKKKHAAKSWNFKFRGGPDGIDSNEIAETLSRRNPVAVVTLLKEGLKQENPKTLIVIHNSLMHKFEVSKIGVHTLQKYAMDQLLLDSSSFTNYQSHMTIVCDSFHVGGILQILKDVKNAPLESREEFVGAVNYPLI